MKTVFITGVSKGLGFALANKFLNENYHVVGIGRKNIIQHSNYQFILCDLSKYDEVDTLNFNFEKDSEIILINNAGVINQIERLSKQNENIARIFQINTVAPIQLCQKFLKRSNILKQLTIINISSGAGRRAIPSWSTYCASKAALDMFSETIQLEEIELGKNTRIFSLAPGIIDTEMQQKIRNSKKEAFSQVENFIEMKDKLKSTIKTAHEIFDFLINNKNAEVVCRL